MAKGGLLTIWPIAGPLSLVVVPGSKYLLENEAVRSPRRVASQTKRWFSTSTENYACSISLLLAVVDMGLSDVSMSKRGRPRTEKKKEENRGH
jgi:hypothetical protein